MHLAQGATASASGDYAAAIIHYREALRLDPELTEARLWLAAVLYATGNLDEAIDAYRLAARDEPDSALAHLGLATTLMVKQDWAAARQALDRTLQLAPDLTLGHDTLGVVRYALGDRAGAIAAHREALRLNPNYPDAHFHLGLVLSVEKRDAEATAEFLTAAAAGVPNAQYFLGNAYASGRGTARELAKAIGWWMKASEQGVPQADEALARLRRAALAKSKKASSESLEAADAFARYREDLWTDVEGIMPNGDGDSPGAALVREARLSAAVPVLMREGWALSDTADAVLARLYEEGLDIQAPYTARILRYFKAAADEGLPQARLALARIYGHGVGVPQDLDKAKALLKGDHRDAAKALLRELTAPSALPAP
jgi:TPR repeat protein